MASNVQEEMMVNNTTNKWVVEIGMDEDGSLVLPFPVEFLYQVGWHEGTELLWNVEDDGTVTMRDKNGTETSS
jgi:hypothetical protein